MDELTDKQKSFCREYIFDWNATRAAIAAGYSKESARQLASETLSKPYIKAYIKEIQKDLEKTAGISRLQVLAEHQKIAFGSIAHLHNSWITRKEFEELTDDQKSYISEISTQTRTEIKKGEMPVYIEFVKIKLYDKQKSLDSISKMLGYNEPEKILHSSEDQIFVIGGKEIKF